MTCKDDGARLSVVVSEKIIWNNIYKPWLETAWTGHWKKMLGEHCSTGIGFPGSCGINILESFKDTCEATAIL